MDKNQCGILDYFPDISTSELSFVQHVEAECIKFGVTLIFSDTKSVEYLDSGLLCSGYFIDNPPTLKIAIDKPMRDWFMVLVHEFSHMKQWVENSPIWDNNKTADGLEYSDIIDQWLNGQDFPPNEIEKAFRIIISLESDCEKRALKLIKEHNLPVDAKEYAQKANAYILFHHMMRLNRKWYKIGKEPYSLDSVWRNMPPHLDIDYSNFSDDFVEYFRECFEE